MGNNVVLRLETSILSVDARPFGGGDDTIPRPIDTETPLLSEEEDGGRAITIYAKVKSLMLSNAEAKTNLNISFFRSPSSWRPGSGGRWWATFPAAETGAEEEGEDHPRSGPRADAEGKAKLGRGDTCQHFPKKFKSTLFFLKKIQIAESPFLSRRRLSRRPTFKCTKMGIVRRERTGCGGRPWKADSFRIFCSGYSDTLTSRDSQFYLFFFYASAAK